MKQSAPVMFTVKVNKPCRAGWKGTGPLALFPAARLETCSSDERCPGVTRIQAAVTLQASRAGSGCDRDTYSIHSQRTICGLEPKTIDLLPSPGAGNEWAKSLKPDSGRDGEQMFEFDGESTSAIVPESVLPHHLSSSFSVSTWMRHAPRADADPHSKEHVLCLADDHKMNRHHYALFVRNCRLILLLRRDFGEGDLNIFRPAEWRLKLFYEVCDDEWHHYAINVRFPNVELFIDGEPFHSTDGKGPEVIDDWPLHPAHGLNTTMVVGACWQGTEGNMKHHLRGWLAGLGVAHGDVQPKAALACLARCREGLSLAPDLYLKSVSVEGDGVADVETLLRRVSYGDARAFPTPGRRNARPAESYIMVLTPQTPSILLNGSADLARDYAHFRASLTVFPDLSALSLRRAAELPLRYDIRAAVTRDGVILTGADTHYNYQKQQEAGVLPEPRVQAHLLRAQRPVHQQRLTVVHPHMSEGGLSRELHPSGMADKADSVARDKQADPAATRAHAHVSPRVLAAHAQRDVHSAETSPNSPISISLNSQDLAHFSAEINLAKKGRDLAKTRSRVNEIAFPIRDYLIPGKQHKYRNISQLEWDNSTM
ncbi:Uncharacterized protein OBRU01_01521 [Operophtera brumata]|uniref:Calsyntenin-1 n=1 Tax=Operophtera brumata TaxID=104452 RepID=A0A0L7LJR1_OPEBR|nr:Uncharacterized protein OBRU01_01521 [Operophtera brumata]